MVEGINVVPDVGGVSVLRPVMDLPNEIGLQQKYLFSIHTDGVMLLLDMTIIIPVIKVIMIFMPLI